jgi:RND family efflux transporter MFP subunit
MAAVILVALLVGGCKPREHAPLSEAGPPDVLVTEVRVRDDIPFAREWVGTLSGSTQSDVRARVQGYIDKQVYREGSLVKAGDVMFVLDARPFVAALEKAKAALLNAQAQQLETSVTAARKVQLYKENAISEQERDTAVQQDAAAKATVEAAQAQVQEAQLNLDYTKVLSPIDGIASIADANVGDLVGPSTAKLATVATVDPITADFYVSEQDYLKAAPKLGDAFKGKVDSQPLDLRLTLADGTRYPHPGTLKAVNLQVDERTGTVEFEASYPNPGNVLRPGAYALVRLTTRTSNIVVPQRAVMYVQGRHLVVVVSADNKASIRAVTVGEESGEDWEILDGLTNGERVVVEGLQKVGDGVTVNAKPLGKTASHASDTTQTKAR